MKKNIIFCLMGPTASGKTTLSIQLCKRFPFRIISVDSGMIYREMNIGTAKPTEQELLETPHDLINIINPNENYSVVQFYKDAKINIENAFNMKKIPLLVGGNCMYFYALQNGLSFNLPKKNNKFRILLSKQINKYGLQFFYKKLQTIDPIYSNKIHFNDKYRIQRALEVYYITKKPISYFLLHKQNNINYNFINIILMPSDKDWLYKCICNRFDHMLKKNFVFEVIDILKKWKISSLPTLNRIIGYQQILLYFSGIYTYNNLRNNGIMATQKLAKRQITWLKHWNNGNFFICNKFNVIEEIIKFISSILYNI